MNLISQNLLKFTKPDLKVVSIYSRIETNLILCNIIGYGKFKSRVDLTDPNQIMQVSLVNMYRLQSVQKHKHLPVERLTVGTSEGWLVLKGCFELEIFDIDQASVGKYLLKKLDMVLMFRGGHSLLATKHNSSICEFKNGPFKGSDSDKVYF